MCYLRFKIDPRKFCKLETKQFMLRRFASAVSVASVAIFVATIILQFIPDFPIDSRYLLTTIWCLIPLVWGLWALLIPKSWLPKLIPLWGAILGLILGMIAIFIIDIPMQVQDEPISNVLRGVLIILATILYYLLWLLVRWMYALISQ